MKFTFQNKDEVSRLEDNYAIKNFALIDPTEISNLKSLKNPLIFDGFIFGICLKGNLEFKINHKNHLVSENEIFTILPHQIFKLIRDSSDLMIETLFLSSDYIIPLPLPKNLDLLKKIDECPTKKITLKDIHDILEMHSLIVKHHQNEHNPYRDSITRGFIYSLLIEIGYLYESNLVEISKTISRQEVLTEMFFKTLMNYYTKERSVAFYADKLCLTPKYLSMTIKKVTGHSILDWINEAVIIEAKKLLKSTDLTVLQISEELNFSNPSFFGRFFKQYAGFTPLEYKNS